MELTRKSFVDWGRIGGRMRARRLTKARLRQIAKKAGSAKRKVGRPHKDPSTLKRYIPTGKPRGIPSKVDADEAERMYRQGKTLDELGLHFGVTRERVRQILKKRGVSRIDGGQTMRIFSETPDRVKAVKALNERRETRIREKWGVSLETWKNIVQKYGSSTAKGSPLIQFKHQKHSAKDRGIAWDLTFDQWWDIWQKSGHYPERGRGNRYCMARFGDSGGYIIGNVHIIRSSQNSSDQYLTRKPNNRKQNRRGSYNIEEHIGEAKPFVVVKITGRRKTIVGQYTNRHSAWQERQRRYVKDKAAA